MDLKYEFYIAAKPEKVWDALVSPEGTKSIYYGSVLESSFKTGSPYQYIGPGVEGDKTIHIYGKILEFSPNKVLTLTNRVGQAYGEQHKNFESRVSYFLEPFGQNTKLTLIHDKWMLGDPSYENTKNGWTFMLSVIKTWVETGKVLQMDENLAHSDGSSKD